MTVTDTHSAWVPQGPQTFGQRLKAVRDELHMTALEAADACGLKRAAWSNWEKGTHMPQRMPEIVEQISTALGVDRDWLMWGRPMDTRVAQSVRKQGSPTTDESSATGGVPFLGPDLGQVAA